MHTPSLRLRDLICCLTLLGLATLPGTPLLAAETETEAVPADAYFEKFHPLKAPAIGPLLLKEGDRLAICGDSITEQKMYSLIIETYLTACVPTLKITARQYGWGGETAEGFLNRMKQDCLTFKPTIATLSYGMNDHAYAPFDQKRATWYTERYTAVVKTFTDAGVRVVLGSAGSIGKGKIPPWVRNKAITNEDMNLTLCAFRDIDIGIAAQQGVRFADVFWPMFTAGFTSQKLYGEGYNLNGGDGVHPGWAGHVVMAYCYLKALGLDGAIGTISVDLKANHATGSDGHVIDGCENGTISVTSSRYPYCVDDEPANRDSAVRSGMTLVPFAKDLNRLMLVATNAPAASYEVTWGQQSKTYTAEQLAAGVNLAEDFLVNPFSAAFKQVLTAVAAKQRYETKQVKEVFHGKEGKADFAKAVERTEAERAPLEAAIGAALVPVRHQIRIVAK
jgi:lysophospholipase L1-like esterase